MNPKAALESADPRFKALLGLGALWLVFSAMNEVGAGEVAEGLALLVAGSAAVLYLPAAVGNLGLGTPIGPQAG